MLRRALLLSTLVHALTLFGISAGKDKNPIQRERQLVAVVVSSPPFLGLPPEETVVLSGRHESVPKRRGQLVPNEKNHRFRERVSRASPSESNLTPEELTGWKNGSTEVQGDGVLDREGLRRYQFSLARQTSRLRQAHFIPTGPFTEGVVLLRVSRGRGSSFPDVAVSRSSGNPAFDNMSHEMLKRALELTPVPSEMDGAIFSFLVPIHYSTAE